MSLHNFIIVVSILIGHNLVKVSRAYNVSDIQALREYLFENSSYDRRVRPAINQSEFTKVSFKPIH